MDVEERGTVEAVQHADLELTRVEVEREERHHAHRDRIRTRRRAQREDATRSAGMAGNLHDDVPAGAVHPVEHDEVTDALKAREAGAVGRLDLQPRGAALLARGADVLRTVRQRPPRRADTADEDDTGVAGQGARIGRHRQFAGPDAAPFHRFASPRLPGDVWRVGNNSFMVIADCHERSPRGLCGEADVF